MQGTIGKCECRRDMRWNAAEGECQIYMDVDCSQITYDTQPSQAGKLHWNIVDQPKLMKFYSAICC